MGKQAVLLLAHGTPETVEQVPEYLRNVVSGRPIAPQVVEEIKHRYALIGKSPLTQITLEQAGLVEEELNGGPHPSDNNKDVARVGHPDPVLPTLSARGAERMGQPSPVEERTRVYVGMRNWRPYIADVVKQMRADGVEQAAVVCMAPQNSRTSVGLYRRAVEAEAQGLRVDFTEGWAQHPLLADAFAERLRPAWMKLSEEAGYPVQVLFTAHSVPKRTVEPVVEEKRDFEPHPSDKNKSVARVGHPAAPALSAEGSGKDGARESVRETYWPGQGADPYAQDAWHTADLVAARVPEIPKWWFAFQSQGASGGEWIGPSVEETLDGMARDGVKALLLQPIGFLCDHVEILFDVDRHFREYAARLGIRLERPESLNASRTLARAVADLARRGLARLAG
jgi:protoporphyrin/coproporphyrin ferrochelatase